MENNHPNKPKLEDDDAELKRIQAQTPGLEDDEPETPEKGEEPEEPAKVTEKDEEPEEPEEEPEEEEGKKPEKPAPGEDEPDEEDDVTPPKRPTKYVPIKQYVEEKNGFKTKIKDLEEKLATYQSAANKAPGSDEEDKALQEIADETGITLESAKKFVALARKGTAVPKDLIDRIEKAEKAAQTEMERAQEIQEKDYFKNEFDTIALPQIQARHKNLPKDKLDAAFAEIDRIAHTKKYHDKSLDYVMFKESAAIDKLLASRPRRRRLNHLGPETRSSRSSPPRTSSERPSSQTSKTCHRRKRCR